MSGFASRVAWLVLGVVTVVTLRVQSQGQDDVLPSRTAFITAQALLQTAFPELFGRRLKARWSVEGPLDVWPGPGYIDLTLEVWDQEPVRRDDVMALLHDALLSAQFRFDVTGELQDAFFRGQHVHMREHDRLRPEINRHPGWSDDEVIDALESAGAKYGPRQRDAFMAELKKLTLSRVMEGAKIERVEFDLRDPSLRIEGGSGAVLTWSVFVAARDGRKATIEFEPFSGRVIRWFQSRPMR